jgi:hypothetical protein
MRRAEVRCKHESATEKLLGYEDTAAAYKAIAEEINTLKWWVLGLEPVVV